MAKSNRSNQAAPDATLAKLLDVDSALATEEEAVRSQLEAVQVKRKSLESVIDIFSSPETLIPAKPAESSASQPVHASSSAQSKSAQSKSAQSKSSVNSTAPSPPKSAKTSAKVSTSAKSTKPTAKSTRSPRAKANQNWQTYVRQEFEETSLPEAVSHVLKSKPNGILGIPDILETIFLDEMPKEVRNKASNRVSNILSTGLKDNKWYRGKMGHYSVSSKAAMADLAS